MAVGTRGDVLRATALTVVVPVTAAAVVMGITSVLARDSTGWDGLGTVLLGMAVAGVVGVVTLVVTALVAFRRALPSGRRLPAVLAAVVGLSVTAAALVVPSARSGPATTLCLLALTVLLPLVVTGHVRWRWVAVVVVAAVAFALVDAGTERWDRDRERRAELARFDGALPLTDGTSLDSPLPGWEHLATTWPYPGSDLPLRIQWRRGAGTPDEDNYVLEVHTDLTDCTSAATEPACTVIGRGAHGDVRREVDGGVFVRVDEVEWRLDAYVLDDDDIVAVLDSLEPVDAETFLRAASRGASY